MALMLNHFVVGIKYNLCLFSENNYFDILTIEFLSIIARAGF